MVIERGILCAIEEAPPDSKQKNQALQLKRDLDALKADGFMDPPELPGQNVGESTKIDIFPQQQVYNHPDFSYDRWKMSIVAHRKHKQPQDLTGTQAYLLNVFIDNSNVFLDKDWLRSEVKRLSGKDNFSYDSLRLYFRTLRHKIEPNPKHPKVFISRKGAGYMFVDPTKLKEETSLNTENKTDRPQTIYSFGDGKVRFYPERFAVVVDGKEVQLSPAENRMLESLARNDNKVVTKEKLMDDVWGEGEGDKDLLRKYIERIRRKIGDDNTVERGYRLIKSVHGVGYLTLTDQNKIETSGSSSTTVFEASSK